MIRVVATFNLNPGNAQKALEIARPLIELTRQEKGCKQYDLAQSIKEENTMVILEAWEDQQSLDDHSASEHFKKYVPELAGLCQEAPIVAAFTQVI